MDVVLVVAAPKQFNTNTEKADLREKSIPPDCRMSPVTDLTVLLFSYKLYVFIDQNFRLICE